MQQWTFVQMMTFSALGDYWCGCGCCRHQPLIVQYGLDTAAVLMASACVNCDNDTVVADADSLSK